MTIGKAGDLRQMCNRNDLMKLRKALQAFSDSLRNSSADADIDFIEHKQREPVSLGKNRFQCKHDA
jgi:hypothetical protein